MKKVPLTINLVTLYAIVFLVAILVALPFNIIYTLFLLAPLPVLFLVYVVLKNGQPSAHNFDERFYDDWDYERNGKEEMDADL